MEEVQAIAEQGFVVFNVSWPSAVMENSRGYRQISEVLSCAVRYARATAADYGGDPSQIILVGHSFGARMGSWFALAGGDNLDSMWEQYAADHGEPDPQVACVEDGGSANVDAFIGIAGHFPHLESLQEKDEDLWEIVSMFAHLRQRPELRVRLLHGEQDTRQPFENSIRFTDILIQAGYDTKVTLFEGAHIVPIPLTYEVILELAGE